MECPGCTRFALYGDAVFGTVPQRSLLTFIRVLSSFPSRSYIEPIPHVNQSHLMSSVEPEYVGPLCRYAVIVDNELLTVGRGPWQIQAPLQFEFLRSGDSLQVTSIWPDFVNC